MSRKRRRRAIPSPCSTRQAFSASPSPARGDGIYLLDPNLLDNKIDADKPELLVYERRNDGSMKLVALEYLIFQALSNGRPSLFGQPFDEIKADNRYGIPASWALHAWIWKPNPSGMLYAGQPTGRLRPRRGVVSPA